MKKIYLFCSAGMSTSMLAQAMQKEADAYGLPVEVKAFPHSQLLTIVRQHHPDVVLLGPQVKYLFKETQAALADTSIVVDVIDSQDYGTMNGERVLKTAVMRLKNRKKSGGQG